MNLKNIFIPVITGCFISVMISSCGSPDKKPDEAFDRVKEKRESYDSIRGKDSLQLLRKAELLKIRESQDEWTRFKLETEKKILANEKTIKEIKGLPDISTASFRKIKKLEKSNNDLRIKMDEYKEAMKVQWENFKTEINHDANEISTELKAMKTDNKK